MRIHLLAFTLFCLVTSLACHGQDTDDPIAAELAKAKEAYLDAAGAAKEKLLATIDAQRAKTESDAKLKAEEKIKQIDKLDAEKRAFEADSRKWPASAELKVAINAYRTALATAKQKCETAFGKAADAYSREKAVAAARAVLAEKETFLIKDEAREKKDAPEAAKNDPLTAGVTLRGTKFNPAGAGVSMTLDVLERNGKAFKARLTIFGMNTRAIVAEGLVERSLVELRTPEESGEPLLLQGRVQKGELMLAGVAKNGRPIRYLLTIPNSDAKKNPGAPSILVGSLRNPALVDHGVWKIDGPDLVQTSREHGAGIFFGDTSWSHYDLKLQAMTVAGTEGFGVYFHGVDRNRNYRFGLGGRGNTWHDLTFNNDGTLGSHKGLGKSGAVKTGQWHDVRIEVRGTKYRCFLDGALLFQDENSRFANGLIGLWTWDTSVRFREISVADSDGKALWAGPPALPR